MALAVIIWLLLPSVAAAAPGGGGSITIIVPALEEPSEKGVLIRVRISVEPGTGEITVKSGGDVGDLARASLREASIVGAVLAGYDWKAFNYRIEFINASNVEGPSASAAVATTIFLVLSRSPLAYKFANTTVMTGAITPLGLYSAIGGVEEKCSAAASAGMTFAYPLANYAGGIPGCPARYESLPGILSAVEYIGNYTVETEMPNISMPAGFEESMREAAEYMENATLRILDSLETSGANINSSSIYVEAVKALEESRKTRESLPYVSASKAFYALYNAFLLQYMLKAQNMPPGDLQDYISQEAARLKNNLTSLENSLAGLPQEGSAYYVEFMGTAFARIASALSELEKVPVLSGSSVLEALSTLAYAQARIYSVHSWLSTAMSVRGLEPYLNESQVMMLSSALGDYAHAAASYSISLANYMIKYYGQRVDTRFLERHISALQMIVSRGDYYSTMGNYVAALGFYREALAESMNTIFSVVVRNESVQKVIYEGYLKEAEKLYSYLASQLSWRGITLGMAPAYMEYAKYEADKGNLETALDLARSGIASAMAWHIYYIAGRQAHIVGEAPGIPGGGGFSQGPGITGVATALLAGLAAGLIIAGRAYRRAIERAIAPSP